MTGLQGHCATVAAGSRFHSGQRVAGFLQLGQVCGCQFHFAQICRVDASFGFSATECGGERHLDGAVLRWLDQQIPSGGSCCYAIITDAVAGKVKPAGIGVIAGRHAKTQGGGIFPGGSGIIDGRSFHGSSLAKSPVIGGKAVIPDAGHCIAGRGRHFTAARTAFFSAFAGTTRHLGGEQPQGGDLRRGIIVCDKAVYMAGGQ